MSFAKTYSEAREKYKALSRSQIKRGPKQMKRRTRRLGPGKKTKQWNSARTIIKRRFEAVGITTCELQGKLKHDCGIDNYLGFAHSKKRRHITGNDLFEVALLCLNAHEIVERLPEAQMTAMVKKIIDNRAVRI